MDADIKGCFDNIPHATVNGLLARHIADGSVLHLIAAALEAGVMEELRTRRTANGTPQGGVISPLLCNIALHELDTRLERERIAWVRYADDFLLLSETREQAERALGAAREALAAQGLELSPEKTRIVSLEEGFDFLGWHYKGFKRWPRDKSANALKEKLRRKTRRTRPGSMQAVSAELEPILRGWYNYFRNGNSTGTFAEVDKWLRRRLRGILRKRTRGQSGISGKSDHLRWPNRYFRENGLFGLMDNFAEYHSAPPAPRHSPTGG